MNLGKLLWSLLSIPFIINGALSLNILGVFPYPGKSHHFVFAPYLRELVRRGHNLTVISYFPQKTPIKNYHDISLAGKVDIIEAVIPIHRSYSTVVDMLTFLFKNGNENCEVMLADEKVQDLWKSQAKFDLMVTENFNSLCALGLSYKLGIPVVSLTSHMLLPWHYEPLGIYFNPSYLPYSNLEGGTKPTMYQKFERSVFYILSKMLYKYMSIKPNEKTLQKYFNDVPPLEELARDVKMVLVYTNVALNGPGLFPPIVKEVGGYHVAKPKTLPQELEKFMNESEHGVIYISFGSMLSSDLMPQAKVEAIVGAISKLPQRIIWKWNSKLSWNLTNVYQSKWLPQNDILAHPNIVAFYSHCGMLGTTEAIHHGVPMIGMPVFGDQPGNAAAIEESGLGVQIQLRDLTEETLLQSFKIVLEPGFRRKVKELSKVWHDAPLSPMDSAVYWTEFAARTTNFTFSSPAATVPLYQYLCLDMLMIILILALICKIMIKVLLNKKPGSKAEKIKTK